MEIKLDKRHTISMKSQGFFQTPQDIMGEYNGCSVPQYTRYPCDRIPIQPVPSFTDARLLNDACRYE